MELLLFCRGCYLDRCNNRVSQYLILYGCGSATAEVDVSGIFCTFLDYFDLKIDQHFLDYFNEQIEQLGHFAVTLKNLASSCF